MPKGMTHFDTRCVWITFHAFGFSFDVALDWDLVNFSMFVMLWCPDDWIRKDDRIKRSQEKEEEKQASKQATKQSWFVLIFTQISPWVAGRCTWRALSFRSAVHFSRQLAAIHSPATTTTPKAERRAETPNTNSIHSFLTHTHARKPSQHRHRETGRSEVDFRFTAGTDWWHTSRQPCAFKSPINRNSLFSSLHFTRVHWLTVAHKIWTCSADFVQRTAKNKSSTVSKNKDQLTKSPQDSSIDRNSSSDLAIVYGSRHRPTLINLQRHKQSRHSSPRCIRFDRSDDGPRVCVYFYTIGLRIRFGHVCIVWVVAIDTATIKTLVLRHFTSFLSSSEYESHRL